MAINNLLNALESYLIDGYEETRKEFAYALNEYIDFRVKAIIDEELQLKEAPKPPKSNEDMIEWLIKYNKWYQFRYD